MITIGLLGGLRPAHLEFYQKNMLDLNCRTKKYHVDYCMVEKSIQEDRKPVIRMYAETAAQARQDGCDAVILCSDILHSLAGAIQQELLIPLLDFRDGLSRYILQRGIRRVFFDAFRGERSDYHELFIGDMSFQMCFASPEAIPNSPDSLRYEYCKAGNKDAVLDPASVHTAMVGELCKKYEPRA